MTFKKILAVLLAAVLCFSLCACGEDGEGLKLKKSDFEILRDYLEENDKDDDADTYFVTCGDHCAVIYNVEDKEIDLFYTEKDDDSKTNAMVSFGEDDSTAEVVVTFEYLYKDTLTCTLDMDTFDPDDLTTSDLKNFEHSGKYEADTSSMNTFKNFTISVLKTIFDDCDEVIDDAEVSWEELGFEEV